MRVEVWFDYLCPWCYLAQDRADHLVAAHDAGRVINPALFRGQITGSVHMGLGYALSEELPCADGMPVSFSRYQLGLLRAKDMPEIEVILVEVPDDVGGYGSKGVGEIGLVPTAGAVAAAASARASSSARSGRRSCTNRTTSARSKGK